MRHPSSLATALVACVLLLGACGSDGDSSGTAELCQHYDDIAATAEDFSELDASETSLDELQARAADFRDRLDELQAAVENERIDTALSSLEQSLASARDTASDAGDKAEERVAQAEDSLDEVNQKWARVQALFADRCS